MGVTCAHFTVNSTTEVGRLYTGRTGADISVPFDFVVSSAVCCVLFARWCVFWCGFAQLDTA